MTRFNSRELAIELDFSEKSLEGIDRVIVDRTRDGLIDAAGLAPDAEEHLWTFCKMLGGYMGEVMIRNRGAAWELREGDAGLKAVLVSVDGTEGSPPEFVWRAVTEPQKTAVSYFKTWVVARGQAEVSTENGIQVARVALSARPRPARTSQ